MAKYQPRHTKKEKFENMPYKAQIITMIDNIKNNETIEKPVETEEERKAKIEKNDNTIINIILFFLAIPLVIGFTLLKVAFWVLFWRLARLSVLSLVQI